MTGMTRETADKCVYYLKGASDMITICTREAPYMVDGCSFCREHVAEALAGKKWNEI
jgi:hypothetical protein